jgi:isoleucyl-tRNA synthetase
VWECSSCGAVDVVGSIAQIEQKSGQQVTDLHRPYIDAIFFPCACGATKTRIPEVLDCRFESGAMPYGQDHFMKQEDAHTGASTKENSGTSNFTPEVAFSNCANFIAEGLDQTRGWFRALHVLGHAYHGQNVFQNVVVT